MKRKIYIIFSILTVPSIATYFGFQHFNQATQEPEMVLDFGKEGTEMRRMETKNLSPYAIFGDSSVVLMTEAEEKGIIYLDIPNRNKNVTYSKMNLDLRTGIVKIYDNKGNLVETSILRTEVLARFISVDRYASKYPDLNPYNFTANNPLRYTDPTGDTIEVAGNQASKDDISSLVRSKNQQYLSYNGNNLTINFGNMAQKDIDKLLRKDKGLSLLNDMVNSSHNFMYAATEVYKVFDKNTGTEIGGNTRYDNNKVGNYATTSYYPAGVPANARAGEYQPLGKYEGYVVLHPTAIWYETDGITKKPRQSLILHELRENYERVHNQQPYSYIFGGVDYGKPQGQKGAHDKAVDYEYGYHNASYDPGMVGKIVIPK